MTKARDNVQIWNEIYATGHMLWYPYEIVVRIVHRLKREGRLGGVILDHGCGSGNHLEFLTRMGLDVIGTEISQASLSVIKARFAGAKLKMPDVSLIDLTKPLGPQLPRYDHLLAWGSTHYNRRDKFLRDLGDLIAGLSKGGLLILDVPTCNDAVRLGAQRESDGTFRLVENVSGQKGALITIPDSQQELISWCKGIDVEDCGTYSWTLSGVQVEHYFLFGTKM